MIKQKPTERARHAWSREVVPFLHWIKKNDAIRAPYPSAFNHLLCPSFTIVRLARAHRTVRCFSSCLFLIWLRKLLESVRTDSSCDLHLRVMLWAGEALIPSLLALPALFVFIRHFPSFIEARKNWAERVLHWEKRKTFFIDLCVCFYVLCSGVYVWFWSWLLIYVHTVPTQIFSHAYNPG